MSDEIKNTGSVSELPQAKPKKPIFKRWWFWVIVVLIVISTGFVLGKFGKLGNTTAKTYTLQELASINNYSVGQIGKGYRLTLDNKNADGTYMVINFIKVKAVKHEEKGGKSFDNFISILNVPPVAQTREMLDKAATFRLFDEKGEFTENFSITTEESSGNLTEIILYSDRNDLTKYKYLAFGPINDANSNILLFEIKSEQ
jgi:hypothetical protein